MPFQVEIGGEQNRGRRQGEGEGKSHVIKKRDYRMVKKREERVANSN